MTLPHAKGRVPGALIEPIGQQSRLTTSHIAEVETDFRNALTVTPGGETGYDSAFVEGTL